MNKASIFFDKFIAGCIYATVALIPIFFLPITAEAVEFNKQFLLYFLTTLGLIAWIVKGIVDKKLFVKKTPFNLPLLLIAAVLLIASVLSQNRMLSFWGDFAALDSSFFSFLFYFLFYFLVLNNVNSFSRVLRIVSVLIVSALVSVVYFMIQAAKILPWPNLPIPQWTVTSDLPSHFGYFLAVILALLFSLVMAKGDRFWTIKNIFGLLGSAVIFAGLVMLGFKTVWLIAAIAIFLLLVFSLSRIDEVHIPWVSVSFGVLVVSIIFILLGTPKILTANLPTEVTLSSGVSWTVAASALSNNLKSFLFGTGPATFVYDFSAYRPEMFNENFAWSLRFNKSYSTALDFLTSGGLLGAISFMLLILTALGTFFVAWFMKNLRIKKSSLSKISDFMHLGEDNSGKAAHALFAGLLTAWLTLLISMFLITFTTVHWVMFFLFLALTFLVGSDFGTDKKQRWELSLKSSPQYTLVASFIYILLFAVIVIAMIFMGRFYAAEVCKGRAAKYSVAGNHIKAAADMFRAISLNTGHSRYYLDLASAYVGMATVEAQKSQPDQQTVSNLVASAVNQAREATRLAPNDVTAWDFLATMYATARPLSANANDFVISSLQKAIELEKTNPRLYLDLGRAKIVQKDLKGGREAIERAVALKKNYTQGYFVLAQLDEMEGKINLAIEHMSAAAASSPSDPLLLFNLGRLYYNRAQADDLVRAEQLYGLALNNNPNYADALWSLGVLYERQGKITQAVQLYQQVQRLNPGNADVENKIQRLNGGQ
jgi:tetratricopeptide (TPR) repeat protein